MAIQQLDPKLAAYLDKVLPHCSSRARYVIETIRQQGFIGSDQIQAAGFLHGARTVGDVREQGIPIQTKKTKGKDGRSIALYVFGSPDEIKPHMFGGRIAFPPKLKQALLERDGNVCAISKRQMPADKLQIDHRVPYYIAGEGQGGQNPKDFMLLSPPMQRAKSWACENCDNGKSAFNVDVCRKCYWASPDDYTHVATNEERRLDLTFTGSETRLWDRLKVAANERRLTIQDMAKRVLDSGDI